MGRKLQWRVYQYRRELLRRRRSNTYPDTYAYTNTYTQTHTYTKGAANSTSSPDSAVKQTVNRDDWLVIS
jgi:hypothetical protein